MSADFQARLKHVRENVLRMTQAELAARCGWHPSMVGHLEGGVVRRPSFENLKTLCEATDTSADYFLGLTSDAIRPRK